MVYYTWTCFDCHSIVYMTLSLLGQFFPLFTYDLILARGLKLCRWFDPKTQSNPISQLPHHHPSPWLLRPNWIRPLTLRTPDDDLDRHGVAVWWLPWKQGRESGGDKGQKIKDDEDGHLVYTEGDILQARCTCHFVMFSSRISLSFFFLYC